MSANTITICETATIHFVNKRKSKKEIPGTAVDTQHSRDSNTQKLLLKLKTVSN